VYSLIIRKLVFTVIKDNLQDLIFSVVPEIVTAFSPEK